MNEKESYNQVTSKKYIFMMGFAVLILLSGIVFYCIKGSIPDSAMKKEELLMEFHAMQPLPGAILSSFSADNKTAQAGVSVGYWSNKSFPEICSFYIEEAKKNGWTLESEDTVIGSGSGLGGKAIHFRKGECTLSIQYAGEGTDYSWDYAVTLGWNDLSGMEQTLTKFIPISIVKSVYHTK